MAYVDFTNARDSDLRMAYVDFTNARKLDLYIALINNFTERNYNNGRTYL